MADERSQQRWQHFDILAKATIPLILFYATFQINNQFQERAQLQLQADRAERMLSRLLSEREEERLATLAIVSYLAKEQQFPQELLPVLTHLASRDKQENVAEAATETLQKVAEQAAVPEVKSAARETLRTLPMRVYIHIRSDAQMPAAEHLQEILESNGVAVPSIVPVKEGPAKAELRFYRAAEKPEAEKIINLLRDEGIGVSLRDLSDRPDFKQVAIRARTFEFWFAP